MFTLKTIFTLVIGIVLGISIAVFWCLQLWDEPWTAKVLTMHSVSVHDFAVGVKSSDKDEYCIRYRIAKDNSKLLKTQLEKLDYDASSSVLQSSMGMAWDALDIFSKIEPENLRHQCGKT
jgi:hypothetical protein